MTTSNSNLTPDVQTTDVAWLDVNTLLDVNGRSDLLPGVQAINNSLYNLFRCNIGARGPIFDPEYGTSLYPLLHEPLDYITAGKVRMFLIQAIQRWEPRVILDMNRTTVVPNHNLPGFVVSIYYSLLGVNETGNYTINLSALKS